jgi:hypothetical protein
MAEWFWQHRQQNVEEENEKTIDHRKGRIMPRMKTTKRRITVDGLKTKTLTDQDQEKVKGGKTPSPGGPVPIPYPNLSK